MILVSCVDATCRYESELKEETVGSYPWIVYTVLSELIMKIIPALLLVVLNTMIIIKFKKTRISVAKNNQGIERQRGALTKRNSIYAGVQQRNSYSLAKRRRDQNLINLLFVLYFIFLLTNMPMAVGRIMIGCGIDTKVPPFREFEVVSNTLEVVFAASNFYLYCLCNTQIRTKVDKVLHIYACLYNILQLQVASWFRKAKPSIVTRVSTIIERQQQHDENTTLDKTINGELERAQ